MIEGALNTQEQEPNKKAAKLDKRLTVGMVLILVGIVVATVLHKSPPPASDQSSNQSSGIQVEGNLTKVGFEYIKNANYDFVPGKPVPPAPTILKQLDGKTVEMTGFAMPLYSPDGKTEFLLTQSANGCCFGAPPQLQHMILVRATGPQLGLDDISRPVRVRGRFSVGEEKDSDGYVTSLLRISAEAVQPVS